MAADGQGSESDARQIGRYRILHEIGRGGMATVYAALQPHPRRTVALKVLRSDVIDDTAVRRFRREAEILARLRHPSIAQVYDAGTYEQDGRTCPYFVMEYIPGAKTILEYVAQKQLDRRERLKLFISICRAVQYGHQHRVLHRDLKPGNILIDQSGRLKIIDFGVASAPDLRVSGTTMNTEAGRLVGTIQYMSPEQVSADPQNIDVRSDVYALGVLLYKLMTGQFPSRVEGQPIYEAVRVVREEPPIPPGRHDPQLRGDLESIILRAIAKDRSRRYQSVGEMSADIVRYLNRQPIHAASAGVTHRSKLWVLRQRKLIVSAAAVVMLVGGAVGATAWWLNRDALQDDQPGGDDAAAPQRTWSAADQAARQAGPRPMTLHRHKAVITSLAFDGGGGQVISGSDDDSALLWSLESVRPVAVLNQHEHDVTHVAVSRDGRQAASLDTAGMLNWWDAASGTVQVIDLPIADVLDAAMDAAGDRLALGGGDSTVRVYERREDRWRTIRGTTGPFHCVSFNADGSLLLGSSQRGAVSIWNAATGERLHRLTGWREPAVRLIIDDARRHVMAIGANGDGALWKLPAADEPLAIDPIAQPLNLMVSQTTAPLSATALSPGGHWLALSAGGAVRVWDLRGLTTTGAIEPQGEAMRFNRPVTALAIDANGQRLAVGRNDGAVQVYALADLLEWAQQQAASPP